MAFRLLAGLACCVLVCLSACALCAPALVCLCACAVVGFVLSFNIQLLARTCNCRTETLAEHILTRLQLIAFRRLGSIRDMTSRIS